MLLVSGQRRPAVDSRIYDKIKVFVDRSYSNDTDLANAMNLNLRNNDKLAIKLKPYMLYDQPALETTIKPFVESYKKFYTSKKDLFISFKLKALNVFPHFQPFIESFCKFLWKSGHFEDVRKFANSEENFQSKIQGHLKNYIVSNSANKQDIEQAIKLHIKAIMKNDLKISPAKITKTFNDFLKRHSSNILNDSNLLTDSQKLTQMIHQFLNPPNTTPNKPNQTKFCLSQFESKITKIIQDLRNPTELQSALLTHFEDNKCAAQEICSNKLNFDDAYLKKELKPYIKAFEKFHENRETEGNKKIVDEIDETVYEIIREVLNKGDDSTKSDCIVDYMIRTKKIDKVYSLDLLFDEALLVQKINPIVRQYKVDYKY